MFRITIALLAAFALGCAVSAAQEAEPAESGTEGQPQDLPFSKNFEPGRYLGKWYEAARLPTPIQPKGTLATAEYSKGKADNEIIVKNTAYSAEGEKLVAIEGKARLLEGDPPRLAVSFGPIVAKEPNYFVMYVDKEYRHAVVGTPNRKSLWILVREVPVPDKTLKALIKIAEEAGFDTESIFVAPWQQATEK